MRSCSSLSRSCCFILLDLRNMLLPPSDETLRAVFEIELARSLYPVELLSLALL
jgi:hypothetical protein